MDTKNTRPTLTTSVTIQPSVKYDLIPWDMGDPDGGIGLSLAELRERLLTAPESGKYDLIVWHNGTEESDLAHLERPDWPIPDGAVNIEDHIGMTLAELREMVGDAEREPMTDAEALAQWAELGRVMQHRAPEVMRCYMDMVDAFLAKLTRKEVVQ